MSGASAAARGFAVRGVVWPGGGLPGLDDALVVVGADGRIAAIAPFADAAVPAELPVVGAPSCWVGPGVIDTHVHLAFATTPSELLSGGVTTARDLGAPPDRAANWRTTGRRPGEGPRVAVAGPLLTAPGGYPTRSWGADRFAVGVAGAEQAAQAVLDLGEVDLVKVAIEPAGGPVPDVETVRAIVDAAHARGLGVTAHALTVSAVETALAASVDELAHTPVEPLPPQLIVQIATADVSVVSSLHTFVAGGVGRAACANAAALHAAGVRLCYGTDLGNADTTPGVDPRELRLLADCGLGPAGALRAATDGAASVIGLASASGVLTVGAPADLVVLDGDPLSDPDRWRSPRAVAVGGVLHGGLGSTQ